jgi:hypothetical protein
VLYHLLQAGAGALVSAVIHGGFMKFAKLAVITALGAVFSGLALADTYRFDAVSASAGALGYLEYDSSTFDGSSFQFVDNSFITAINFTDPTTSVHVTTPALTGGTFFDSTGALPAVVGGSNFTGGTDFTNGLWIAGTNFAYVGPTSYSDVTWSTSVVAVPEPEVIALVLAGLGVVGFAARRNKA